MTKAKWSQRNIRRVLILLLVVAAVIWLVIDRLDTFGNILLVMLGFGTVILVHEFGHFIVAKLSDIEVEAFSMFMPPTLLGIKRTEKGLRIRVLPGFLEVEPPAEGEGEKEDEDQKKEKETEEQPDGSLVSFTAGGAMKPGETEYQLGLIPFGGFVKMLGQEDVGAAKSTNSPRSFSNKRIRTRMAVIAAGVTFNAITAIVIFVTAFLIGIKLPPAIVGGVIPGSPADEAGLRAGDQVLEIEGKTKDLDFSSIQIAAALSGRDEMVRMHVKHEDGTEETLSVIAKDAGEDSAIKGVRVFGVLPPMSLDVATITEPNDIIKLKENTGFAPGDHITAIADTPVDTYWALEDVLDRTFGPTVSLTAERKGKDGTSETVQTEVPLDWPFARKYSIYKEDELFHIGSLVPRLKVAAYRPPKAPKSLPQRVKSMFVKEENEDGPKALQKGDIVVAIGDVNNPTYLELRDVTKEHKDKEMSLKVLRDGNEVTVTVTPREFDGRVIMGVAPILDSEHAVVAKAIVTEEGAEVIAVPRGATITAVNDMKVENFHDIASALQEVSGGPVKFAYVGPDGSAGEATLNVSTGEDLIALEPDLGEAIPLASLKKEYRAANPVQAVAMGWRKTVMFITQAYSTFKTLFEGLVSPKQLMGPIGILHASYKIVEDQPLIYYVYFLGLINAAIAVFNFLPFLPLDGGLAALMLLEKVRGKPLSERVMAVMANAAWIVIGLLALYVTFNDITRIVFS